MQGFSLDLRVGFWGLWLVFGAVAAVFVGLVGARGGRVLKWWLKCVFRP